MYQIDYDEFKKTLSDLCVSVNRPFNDDLARVFWEDLKYSHLSEVRERAKFVRACGKTRFTAHDLRPEKAAPAEAAYIPPPKTSWQERTGNYTLLRFLLSRGPVSDETVPKLLETKNRLASLASDDDDATELRDVMMSAFEKVAA